MRLGRERPRKAPDGTQPIPLSIRFNEAGARTPQKARGTQYGYPVPFLASMRLGRERPRKDLNPDGYMAGRGASMRLGRERPRKT